GAYEVLTRLGRRKLLENDFGNGVPLVRRRAAVGRREEREVAAAGVERELTLAGARLPRSEEGDLRGLERPVGGDPEARPAGVRRVLEHAPLLEDAVRLTVGAEVVAVESDSRCTGVEARLHRRELRGADEPAIRENGRERVDGAVGLRSRHDVENDR